MLQPCAGVPLLNDPRASWAVSKPHRGVNVAGVFLEIIFDAADLAESGIEGRDEIEDPLEERLSDLDLGEVSGGGSGSGSVIIDVEINDEQELDKALSVICQVLRKQHVPPSTVITRHKPRKINYQIYD